VILLIAAGAVFLSFSQGTGSPPTTSSSAVTSGQSTGSPTSSRTSTTASQASSSYVNKSQVIVVVPPGIEDLANKVSFEPINITVVIGVNNTVVFVNHDDLEHIIESNAWPSNGQPFQFYSFPGQSNTITLTTPGKYTYFCEWHPIWMDGTIIVLP